ncbi:MAG: M1 family metallopeptidase [Acidobacteriota bacterium]|nr:M1 family metallopeptidase [Acidobacteriota bacterium]
MKLSKLFSLLFSVFFFASFSFAQRDLGARPTETGGVLIYEQAAYDVKNYDITLRVNPAEKSIAGETIVTAKIVQPTAWFVLDLDTPLTVAEASEIENGKTKNLPFERRGGRIWIKFPQSKQPDETVSVRVKYAGVPRVAPRAPWVGGFVWSKTASGEDWIAVACQNDGADVWFPSKDHPSDEADTVGLHITVPENLYAALNGKLQNIKQNDDKTKTYNWFVSNTINNYVITLNIAPYKIIEDKMKSVTGETIPIFFYVLPEHFDKGAGLIAQFKDFVRFFEEKLGPYPFRSEKLGIAETPYLGMEHSTIIAYGNNFKNNQDGFDGLLFHELGHEWWGNLVTASDWRDFWIHEGFQSFMDELYVEKLKGRDVYLERMAARMKKTRNMQAVAPREPKIAYQVYMSEPDYLKSDGDIYGKGAVVLHTLRYLIGDAAFFRALRRMAYPTKEMEELTNGKQTRLVTTDDFLTIAEAESGMRLDWFFEVYLRQPKLPKIVTETKGNQMILRWDAPNNLPFPMPVDVEVSGKTQRVEMKNGTAAINFDGKNAPLIDPKSLILKAE